MLSTSHAAPAAGPAFIRQLARLTDAEVPLSGPALAERLGRWIDWTRAVALSRALDGTPPATAPNAPGTLEAVDAECARVRAALADAIHDDAGLAAPGAPAEADYAPFHQHYLARQRAMQAATGRLRGQLRDRLAGVSAAMARLAEVDAVMEMTLSPREHTLLAAVPALLGERFDRLRQAARPAPDEAPGAPASIPPAPDAWLAAFRHDMRGMLLAELDVRFQPIDGLLAALRSR